MKLGRPLESQEQTHFGFQKVLKEEKVHRVARVFDSVSQKYDVMNDVMSLGIHRLWKRFAVDCSGVLPGHRVLDLGGGTGDLTAKFSRIVSEKGQVILSDINGSMLNLGRSKLRNLGAVDNIYYVQANAEELPFQEDYFDCVAMGFCLRNVTSKDRAMQSVFSVLKPGGRLIILEFSKLTVKPLRNLYNSYLLHVLPKIGKLVASDAKSYRYLAESIHLHPNQEALKTMMESAGFERVSYSNLTGGIVALHRGYKF